MASGGDPFDDDPEKPARETQAPPVNSLMARYARSRIERMAGAEAASIGIVLGGSVAVGYFGGSWLDGHFGTTYWMPIGLLFGVGAGFRELFHIIRRLNAQTQRESAERKLRGAQNTALQSAPGGEFRRSKGAPLVAAPDAESEAVPSRMFSVPPPPAASFEKQGTAKPAQPQSAAKTAKTNGAANASGESLEELTQRLLQEGSAKPDDSA